MNETDLAILEDRLLYIEDQIDILIERLDKLDKEAIKAVKVNYD